ncbi:MAG: SH3 domain-containing protein, partial [Phycisphaerae bacterium]|nr:SH3 domain-containing protein [Phycisphaerae bacterium]
MNPCCNTTYTQTMLLANLWFILSLACPAVVGQTQIPENRSPLPQPASQPTAQAYWLRVTADRLNVRSQPDANSIVVTRVERDAILRALGSRFGWHRVLPPEGVFSYVSAAHVERQSETEGLVAVRSGTLRVRVGSLVRELDPLKSEVQTLLERGTPVRIVGAQGEWLKIVPPEGVYLYVSDKYVQQVSDEVAARLGAAITTTPQPAGITSGEPSPQPIAVAATQPAEGPDLSGPWGRRLVQVETAITAQAARPALEQAWDEPLTHLRPIAAQRAEPLAARLAAAWIVQLEERGADQEALRAAEEVLQRTARERARHERELERIKRLRQRAASQPAFSAR